MIDIQAECGLSPWSRNGYEAELERADAIMLVAKSEEDDATVGFIIGRVTRFGPGADGIEAEIYNIGTRLTSRNSGIGSRLMTEFVRICSIESVRRISLEVRVSNRSAIRFYAAKGFVTARLRRDFYTNPVEDAEVMELGLV
ncbi:MAG: hypothetical protein DMF63_18420 [Acidobacteria bacterium]|nr:MAG: hypothetical protein DMF63_18420 [Acidobacteriota bacterium]